MAADSSFGVALVGLWHEVAQAGGGVGFTDTTDRADVARLVAPIVDDLRRGRALAVAVDQGRRLVGAAVLHPGPGARAHTGRLDLLVVEPALTGCGLGRAMLTALLDDARARGLDRVGVEFGQDDRVQRFFERFGFQVWGRRPGWQRLGPGVDRDETIMGLVL
ncbi:GNAT family N-acetyltransferase [Nakamurella sp.]|uniref:GNAT family N-acetyltransferase n=1 Tax=Nakamurella sp. TaxID=1869182 RepID=UPI003784730F